MSDPTLLCVLCYQIDYFNNQIIVDLVEQQHKGIFSVLDEACMNVGKVTDEVFLQGLNGKLAKHAHYTSRKVAPPKPSLWLKSHGVCHQTMNKNQLSV